MDVNPAPEAAPTALRFALLVTGPSYGTQAASDAYRFAQAVLAQAHVLSHVFFYQEGVHNANHLVAPASDETNLQQAWVALAQTQGLRLDVCVAAALRRGVCDAASAEQAGLSQWNLAEPFYLSGLGQLAEAALTADRVVQF
ncbi:sulfurtransferase TusD [Oceanisphaera profunda]|uniref:Sulfurtransferase TusD n=1 Tax=Oceanisphaera profunda TaxID=1416627 RepID=A0A1Y0D3P0_9GAMM|nr:sulfurtransferase complex subunit TusD [Oceanisphaera profunda]ART82151.1 sulfurtransferase TusD [Oceanisphaera profunda]